MGGDQVIEQRAGAVRRQIVGRNQRGTRRIVGQRAGLFRALADAAALLAAAGRQQAIDELLSDIVEGAQSQW